MCGAEHVHPGRPEERASGGSHGTNQRQPCAAGVGAGSPGEKRSSHFSSPGIDRPLTFYLLVIFLRKLSLIFPPLEQITGIWPRKQNLCCFEP